MKNIDELIDRFFDRRSTREEKLEAQEQIEQLKNKKELEFERLVSAGIYSMERDRILKDIRSIKSDSKAKVVPILTRKKFWTVGIAASFILLAAVIGLKYNSNDSNNYSYIDQLMAYNDSELGKLTVRGNEEIDDQDLENIKNGLIASRNRKHQEAKILFLSVNDKFIKNEYAVLQVAIQDYFLENYGEIIESKDVLLSLSDKSVRQEAEWLLINSYIADGSEKSTYQPLLDLIASNSSHKYYSLAKQLLE